jgi:membrane fusion protein (multidrug efflux system)
MNNKKKLVITVIGFIVLSVMSVTLFDHFSYVTTDNAQIFGHSLMLAPKVSGYITKVDISEGQKVKKGEALIEIDSRDYENTLKQVKGELASIEARRKDAERNYHRIVDLLSKGAVSQQQFDTSTAQYNDVKAKYDAIASQVAQAELNITNTKILAPTDGFIAKKSAEVGQLAAPGIPLIGFVDSEERWIIANFKETDIENIKLGSIVDIEVDAISHKAFHGKVDSISSATGATFTLLPPDNATGNFTKVVQRVPVKIIIENLTLEDVMGLKTGLSALVKVHKR